jgi:hypothetical protein
MWPFSRLRDHRYCAFCKVLRTVYVRKHVSPTNVLLSAAFAAAVTFATFGELDPVGLVVFCVSLTCSEVFVYTRWRMNIVCNLCGFDPILYKRSPSKAALRVKEFFHEQVENPEFWLTKSPLLDVQRRIRAQEKKTLEHQVMRNRQKAKAAAVATAATVPTVKAPAPPRPNLAPSKTV